MAYYNESASPHLAFYLTNIVLVVSSSEKTTWGIMMLRVRDLMLSRSRLARFLSQDEKFQSEALLLRPIGLLTFAGWFILGLFAWTPGTAGWPDYFSSNGLMLIAMFVSVLLFTVHECIFLVMVVKARKQHRTTS
jgi:hypothetical protein